MGHMTIGSAQQEPAKRGKHEVVERKLQPKGPKWRITYVLPWHRSYLELRRKKSNELLSQPIHRNSRDSPLSSISRVAGVSSSLIRTPSYKNLQTSVFVFNSVILVYTPNSLYVFTHFVGVGALKFAEFCAPFDFKEDFFS